MLMNIAAPGFILEVIPHSMRGCAHARRLKGLARLTPGSGLEAVAAELGGCSAEVVLAALEATDALQASLLQPAALGPGGGRRCSPIPSMLLTLFSWVFAAPPLLCGAIIQPGQPGSLCGSAVVRAGPSNVLWLAPGLLC